MFNQTTTTRMTVASLILCTAGLLMSGCAMMEKNGTLIGAAVGAAAGQWIGKDTKGTLLGAGAGAAAGYLIGSEAEKRAAQDQEWERRDAEASNDRGDHDN